MKLTLIILALATLLSMAAAQGLGDLPDCAVCCCLSPSLGKHPTNKLNSIERLCNQRHSQGMWH